MDKLPNKFKITSTGKPFLRYMEYVDPAKKKLMMIFISDQGAWTLGHSMDLYCDGTFESCPNPFAQSYFIIGQMGPARRRSPACLPSSQIRMGRPT